MRAREFIKELDINPIAGQEVDRYGRQDTAGVDVSKRIGPGTASVQSMAMTSPDIDPTQINKNVSANYALPIGDGGISAGVTRTAGSPNNQFNVQGSVPVGKGNFSAGVSRTKDQPNNFNLGYSQQLGPGQLDIGVGKQSQGGPAQGQIRYNMPFEEDITEAFDQPYSLKWAKSEHGDYDALARLDDGSPLSISFEHVTPYEVAVSFERGHSLDVTGAGDAQRVFATVLAAIKKFLEKEQPANISFSASKEVEPGQSAESRAKLYNRLVDRYATKLGYSVRVFDQGSQVEYELYRGFEPPFESHGLEEQQLDELSFLGSECTKDCSGHRAGYDWSKRKGLRQANSWSPSFNKGAGLAVAGK